MSSITTIKPQRQNPSRRAVIGGAVASAGTAAAFGAFAWNRFDLRSRLFNPFTQKTFELAAVPGARLANGGQAPGFSAADLKGHVTVLNFWASWCPPCVGEHPNILALSRDGRARVFGANYKDSPDAAAAFLAAHGNPYAAVGDDRNGFVSRAFGARGAPWTYIIDKDGSVALEWPGPIEAEHIASRLLPAIARLV